VLTPGKPPVSVLFLVSRRSSFMTGTTAAAPRHPVLALVDDEELERRKDRRVSRPR
jgi:hypothetical protein